MKRLVGVNVALLMVATTALRADVTVTQTLTVEGAAVAAGGQAVTPKVVTRIKGTRARTEVDAGGMAIVTIADYRTGRVIALNPADKTARILEPGANAAAAPANVPKPDITVKPTGQKRTIDGVECEEHALSVKLNFGDLAAPGSLPPETAAAMKDVRMTANGTSCVVKTGPGIAEYMEFQKNAATLLGAAGTAAPMMNVGTLERLMGAAALPGLAYAGEVNLSVEGTGPLAAMIQQLGPMKVITKTVSVSVDPIADALFEIPADYKVVK